MQQTYAAVQRDLLEANHLSPDLLAQSLSIIGANHVDYADIYCQRTAYESWHLEEGIVKSGSFQIDQAWACVPFRAIKLLLPTPTACVSIRLTVRPMPCAL